MALVAALFTDGVGASAAVDALAMAGYGDDLEVIDKVRLTDEYPHNLAPGGLSGQPAGVIADDAASPDDPEELLTVGNIREILEDGYGVAEEESLYFARKVKDGDSLFLVETDEVAEVKALLEEQGAVGTAEV